jgi:predicted PurR-regulated permease PerM
MNESSNRNSNMNVQAKGQEEGAQPTVPQQSQQQQPYPQQDPYEHLSRKDTHKQPWYNQRWLTALVILIGVGVLTVAISAMTQSVDSVNTSIQEQTKAIEEQTGVLAGISREVQVLTDAVKDGFNRLVNEIRDIANQWTNSA